MIQADDEAASSNATGQVRRPGLWSDKPVSRECLLSHATVLPPTLS